MTGGTRRASAFFSRDPECRWVALTYETMKSLIQSTKVRRTSDYQKLKAGSGTDSEEEDGAGELGLSPHQLAWPQQTSNRSSFYQRHRARVWETAVVLCLFSGWFGSYFCRNHLYVMVTEFKVSSPPCPSDLPNPVPVIASRRTHLLQADENVSQSLYGGMMTAGFIAYFFGKLCFGPLVDRFGGRVAMLITLVGAPLCSLLFTLGHRAGWFFFCWVLIRFFQPSGWIGLIKLCGAWVPRARRGRTMAFLSCSFLVGGAVTRLVLGALVAQGLGWRQVFWSAAALEASFALPAVWILQPSPKSVGLAPVPAEAWPRGARPVRGLRASAMATLGSRQFWSLCAVTIPLVAVRE